MEKKVREFRAARNWPQTDTAENLTAELIAEIEELREDIRDFGIPARPRSPKAALEEGELLRVIRRRAELMSHVADIGIYTLALCDHLDIDLQHAVERKMADLEDKYPTPLRVTEGILRGPGGCYEAGSLPLEHLLELWGDYDICDWQAVACHLSGWQKDEIFQRWHWSAIIGIARNLGSSFDRRRDALRIIDSNIPAAIEELLTYEDPGLHGLSRGEVIKGVEILRANLENTAEATGDSRSRLRWIEIKYDLPVSSAAEG